MRDEKLINSTGNGHFNAYGNAARKDKHDYVIHLGDYIYEHARPGGRVMKPPRILWTLGDYRTRHGQVRADCGVAGERMCCLHENSTEPTLICSFFPRTTLGLLLGMITVG